MSAASVSPHGFAAVRGRGYRTEETDAFVTSLSQDRDDAWERAARLTALAEELEAEAATVGEAVAALAPQTYETLGRRAQGMLALAVEESEAQHATALDAAQGVHDDAETAARQLREEARAYADEVTTAADARATELLLAAQRTADETREAARGEAAAQCDEALNTLNDMRRRTESIMTGLGQEQADRWDETGRELNSRQTESDARHAELAAYAEAALTEAQRALAEAEEAARHGQEDAEARAAELLTDAAAQEERTVRETERLLREHDESREEMQAHMDHVRNSLTTLTGRAAAED